MKTIKFSVDDETGRLIHQVAAYRFGETKGCLSEYAKMATIQLLRRDGPVLKKTNESGNITD
jgi:hypothetical protein